MSLGNQNSYRNEDNNKKNYDPTVYSPIQFKNPTGVDPSSLSFSYWRNLLKISISPKQESKPGATYDTYDYKNNISIHINHMKARILAMEIDAFLQDPDKLNNIGINSGANGFLTISNGKEFGINSPVLVIRKMDEDGAILSSYAYQFNAPEYHYAIRNFEESSLKFDRINKPNIELIIMRDLLQSYYESTTYAMAYTVIDASKYENSRTNTKIDLLLDNAGVKSNNRGGGGRSFFQRSSDTDSRNTPARNQSSLDDLSSELEDM